PDLLRTFHSPEWPTWAGPGSVLPLLARIRRLHFGTAATARPFSSWRLGRGSPLVEELLSCRMPLSLGRRFLQWPALSWPPVPLLPKVRPTAMGRRNPSR